MVAIPLDRVPEKLPSITTPSPTAAPVTRRENSTRRVPSPGMNLTPPSMMISPSVISSKKNGSSSASRTAISDHIESRKAERSVSAKKRSDERYVETSERTNDTFPIAGLSDEKVTPWSETLGSEAWGLWLLALLQTIATALVFGVVLNYLCAVMGVTWRYTAFFTLFIALVPFYGRTAAVIVKDMTAMPFFLLFVVLFMEYVRRIHIGDRLPSWLICSIVATSIICSLTRKISLYIIVGSFLLLVIVARRRLVSAAISVAVAGIMMAVPVIAYPALRIAPGGTQEMLAIPLQQSAMTYARFRDDMDVDDRAAIESVITCPVEDITDYLHMGADDGLEVVSADAVKDRCFNHFCSIMHITFIILRFSIK